MWLGERVSGKHRRLGNAHRNGALQIPAGAPWVGAVETGAGALVGGGVNAGDTELQHLSLVEFVVVEGQRDDQLAGAIQFILLKPKYVFERILCKGGYGENSQPHRATIETGLQVAYSYNSCFRTEYMAYEI